MILPPLLPTSLAGYQQSEPANVADVDRGGGSELSPSQRLISCLTLSAIVPLRLCVKNFCILSAFSVSLRFNSYFLRTFHESP
jgi:hypothetical protein